MKKSTRTGGVIIASFAAALSLLTASPRALASFEIMVPAYFYPAPGTPGGDDWAKLADAASKGYEVTAILNPNNGPAAPGQTTADAFYLNATYGVRCGVCSQVLGFTFTRYGERDINLVKADVDKYYQFYPVSGIFLDEMVSEYMLDPANVGKTYTDPLGATVTIKSRDFYLGYYSELYNYIKAKTAPTPFVKPDGTPVAIGTRVVGNVGINADELSLVGEIDPKTGQLRKMADDVIVLEQTYKFLTDGSYTASSWNTKPGYRDDLGYLIHTTGASDVLGALSAIDKLGGGIAYVTDRPVGPDTFGALSPYWDTLLANCTFCPTPPPPTPVPEPSSALLALAMLGALAARRRRTA